MNNKFYHLIDYAYNQGAVGPTQVLPTTLNVHLVEKT